MTHTTWGLSEIEVNVRGFFKTTHRFISSSGDLGEIVCPAFGQEGDFHGDRGKILSLRKKHWLGNAFELLEGDKVRGAAEQRRMLARDINVWFDGREYTLQPAGLLNQGWYLIDHQGLTLLEVQPQGLLKQGAYIVPSAALDADLVVFVYFLIYRRWQDDAATVAATSAATS
jgi:hypothetical protein